MEGLTPEFALAFRELMVQSLAQELPVTSKVLASIPDIQREYRPSDEWSSWAGGVTAGLVYCLELFGHLRCLYVKECPGKPLDLSPCAYPLVSGEHKP